MPKKKVTPAKKPAVTRGRPVGAASKINLSDIGGKLDELVTLVKATALAPKDVADTSAIVAQVNWCKAAINDLGKASNTLSGLVTDLINRVRILENKMNQIDFSVEEKEVGAIKDSQVVKTSIKPKGKNESKSGNKKSSKQADEESEPDFFKD